MELHGAPHGHVIWLSLMSEHIVLGLRGPVAANLPDERNARAILLCTISVLRSNGVVPLEHVALGCSDDHRPAVAYPLPRLDGNAVPGENFPVIARLLDGRTARCLSFLV